MAGPKSQSTSASRPAQAMARNYKPGGPKISMWKRIGRVLLWALLVAIVAAFMAWLTIATGGAALPVGVTMLHYLLMQAGIGLVEGCLYGALSEVMGAKQAETAIQAMTMPQARKRRLESVSPEQMETEIRQNTELQENSLKV